MHKLLIFEESVQHIEAKGKIAFLKIDGISLVPLLDFQGKMVIGYADQSKKDELADRCQAYLICYMIFHYQEVVKLVP